MIEILTKECTVLTIKGVFGRLALIDADDHDAEFER